MRLEGISDAISAEMRLDARLSKEGAPAVDEALHLREEL